MDITERYRTKEPPKEHEEAVRMLLETIAANSTIKRQNSKHRIQQEKDVEDEETTTRHLRRKTINNDNRRIVSDNCDRGSLKTMSSSTESSSAKSSSVKTNDSAKMKSNLNLNKSYRNEDSISTTTLSSMVSKSTSAIENDDDYLISGEKRTPTSYKDPIPSRTIAVQCDLKLSSIKRDNTNFFDASMQASSISSTKYGFYNFSQETLEKRRKLQQEEEEKYNYFNQKEENNKFISNKKRINLNQVEAPTSMSELSTSSSSLIESKSYSNLYRLNGQNNNQSETNNNNNKFTSKLSSSAYKLDTSNYNNDDTMIKSEMAQNISRDENGNGIERSYLINKNRIKNRNKYHDSLPARPMTALSYVSNSRLHETKNGSGNNLNENYNHRFANKKRDSHDNDNDGCSNYCDENYKDCSSCDEETLSINQMPRQMRRQQRAISHQVLSSSAQANENNQTKPISMTPTPMASDLRFKKRQHAMNKIRAPVDGTYLGGSSVNVDVALSDNNWPDCVQANTDNNHSFVHSNNNENEQEQEHFVDYKVPYSEEFIFPKQRVGHSMPINQQARSQTVLKEILQNEQQVADQNCLNNIDKDFDENLNRTPLRSAGIDLAEQLGQKETSFDHHLRASTLNSREAYMKQKQTNNSNKKFNSIQRNRDQALDENSNFQTTTTTTNPIHYSRKQNRWTEEELDDYDKEFGYNQQQVKEEDYCNSVDNRNKFINSRNYLDSRLLARNGQTGEEVLSNNKSMNDDQYDIDLINGQARIKTNSYKPASNNMAQRMTGYSQTLQATKPRSKLREFDSYRNDELNRSDANYLRQEISRHSNGEPVVRSTSMRQINQSQYPQSSDNYNNYDQQQQNNNHLYRNYQFKNNQNGTDKRIDPNYDSFVEDRMDNFSDSPSTRTWSNPKTTSSNRKLTNDVQDGHDYRKSSRSYSMRNVNNISDFDDTTLTKQTRGNGMFNYNYINNNNNRFHDDLDESSSTSSNSLERAQKFIKSQPLDFDSQHRLNESGLPEVNSMSSAYNSRGVPVSKPSGSYLNPSRQFESKSNLNNIIQNNNNNNNNNNITNDSTSFAGSNTIGRFPQITGRAMSQQSLTRPTMPMSSGRRVKRGISSNCSGSDVGGSSMSLVSRLHGRYENAHTRTPVIMYIPQVNPKQKTGSSSSLIAQKSSLTSQFLNTQLRKSVKSSKFKSSSQDKLKRSGSSHNGSDSESSSMLRTLVKPRSSRQVVHGSRRGQHNRINYIANNNVNHDFYDVEDMDGVGQLVTDMEGYKFKRRYSIPKDAKINWFSKLKQRVSSSGGK